MLVNLNGNVVNRFGDRYPVPFMEKIKINDTTFEIDLSFYFMKDSADEGDTLWTQYIQSLDSSLQYSIVMVHDFVAGESGVDPYGLSADELLEKYGPIEYNDSNTNLMNRLITGDLSILDIAISNQQRAYSETEFTNGTYDKQQRIYYGNGGSNFYYKINLSNVLFTNSLNLLETGQWTSETHYDSNQNDIIKFSKTITIEGPTELAFFVTYLTQAMKNGLSTTFVAFTTSLDNNKYPNGFTDEEKENIRKKNGPANILLGQVSDLSYEPISNGTQIISSKSLIYKTSAGITYDGEVIQSIEGTYYGNVSATKEDIVGSFSDLVMSTDDEDVQVKVDNLAYILAAHGSDVGILKKLNEFRKSFLETSTATAVGKMHEKLEIRLYNANNAVKRATPLSSVLNLSPVVIDATAPPAATGADISEPLTTDYRPERSNNFIYTKVAKLGAYALPSGDATTREMVEMTATTARETAEAYLIILEEEREAMFSDYKKMLKRCIQEIIRAYIKIINYYSGTSPGTSDLDQDRITYISIGSYNDKGTSEDNLYRTNSGLVDSRRNSNSQDRFGIRDSKDNGGETLLAEFLTYFMSYFHDNSVSSMSVDFMNELVDALEGAADEGSDNDVNDAHDLIEVISDWVNGEMAANLDGDDATGYQKMFQSWTPADLDITQNLKMFKINPTREFDASLYTGRGATADDVMLVESEVAKVIGNQEVTVPYLMLPMLRFSQIDPNVFNSDDAFFDEYKALSAGLAGRDISDLAGVAASYNDTYSYEKTEEIVAELSERRRAALQSGMAVGAQASLVTDILPGVSVIFETEQLIDFNSPNAGLLYYNGLEYLYGISETVDPFLTMDPNRNGGISAFFKQLRFAAASRLLEVIMTPFCYLEIHYGDDHISGYGIDSSAIAKHYKNFIKHYQKYLQAQKAYYLNNKIADAYTDMAMMMDANELNEVYREYNYYLNGYIFFDYEKAWGTASKISKVLSAKKIENFFGRSFCHTFFNLDTARVEKLFDDTGEPGDTTDDYVAVENNYPDNMVSRGHLTADFSEHAHLAAVPVTHHANLAHTSHMANPSLAVYAGTPLGKDNTLSKEEAGDLFGGIIQRSPSGTSQESTEYVGLNPRAFKLVGDGARNDYRLVCFEFQDVDGTYTAEFTDAESGSDTAPDDNSKLFKPHTERNSLLFTVKMSDRTNDILNILAKQYYDSIYKEFEFYYQAALEECSFNSNTDKLNEFFINSIIENYADSPHLAPWYKTALIYNTHLDLVTDVYSGNPDAIRIAAVNDTQILSPYNATLAELESYRDKVRSFYERYYDPNEGELTSAMNDLQIAQGNTLTFGGSARHGGINSEDHYVSIVTNLPEAVNIDYHAYAAASGGSVAVYPDVIDDIT